MLLFREFSNVNLIFPEMIGEIKKRHKHTEKLVKNQIFDMKIYEKGIAVAGGDDDSVYEVLMTYRVILPIRRDE